MILSLDSLKGKVVGVWCLILVSLMVAPVYAAPEMAPVLEKSQKKKAKQAFSYAQKGKFKKALHIADDLEVKELQKLISWLRLRSLNEKISFQETVQFIEENPDWPDIETLQRRAEQRMGSHMKAIDIHHYFKRYPPVSSEGMIKKAEILFQILSDKSEFDRQATELIRRAWISVSLSRSKQNAFVKKYRNYLRMEDHLKRVNYLIHHDRLHEAKRMYPLLKRDYKTLLQARLQLQKNSPGVDRAIGRVPKYLLTTPDFLYDRSRWHLKRRNYGRMYDYMKDVTGDQPFYEDWWKLRHRLVRELMDKESFKKAYHIASNHGAERGSFAFAEGEWLSGWIALRFLDNPVKAYEHFYKLHANVEYPISLSRGAYWAGRAAEANNNNTIARRWFQKAAKYPTTFYGQNAVARLKRKKLILPPFPIASAAEKRRFKNNELVRMGLLAYEMNNNFLAKKFFKHATRAAKTDTEVALISEFGRDMGRHDFSIEISKEADKKHIILLDTGFPMLDDVSVEESKALVFAIIRQESRFDTKAQSHAGARGLMQLMPYTAKHMARQLKLRYSKSRLKSDPDYNIQLGSYFINQLLERFDGSKVLSIASYNAGPANVRRWVKRYGDPTKFESADKVIDWIELIPFGETRNYVQRVLENMQVYHEMLGGGGVLEVSLIDSLYNSYMPNQLGQSTNIAQPTRNLS